MSSVKRLCYCVNNEWRTSATDRYTPVMNPSTGRQIAEAPVCLPDEVESAVQAAKAAYPAWAGKPVGVRTQILFRFRELVNRHFEDLSVLLATEMGKNLDESRGDVHKVVEACEVAVSAPMEIQGYFLMEATRSHDINSCDTVAHGIVDAVTSLEETDKPIVVRLDGNNAEAGRQILAEAALEGVTVVDTMDEAAQTVTAIAHTLSQQPIIF